MRKFVIILIFNAVVLQLFSQNLIEIKPIKPSTRDYNEFGANYYNNGIMYCSNIKNNIIISRQNDDNQSFYDLYYYSEDKKNKENVNALFEKLNLKYNDGPLTYNGNFIVFARNYTEKKQSKNERTNVGLYYCNKVNNNWSEPLPISFCNSNFNYSYPSLNKEGNTLYFSSDLEGGEGKYDIYVSFFKNNNWTNPINLGKNINTAEDDISPYIFNNKRLYFASNKTSNFDIYYSDVDEKNEWQKPFALTEPINTRYNDFAFICDSTTENGYFSSDRKGTDDIFKFYSVLPSFETCDTMPERNYCYHFEEAKTVDMDSIPAIYEWNFGDSTIVKSYEADHCFSGPGEYNIILNMIDTITGKLYKMIASYMLSVEDPIAPYIDCPDSASKNTQIIFDASKTNMPENKIDQYIWQFSDNIKLVGDKVHRTFEKPGIYRINLGVAFDKDKSGNIQKKCVFKDIKIY